MNDRRWLLLCVVTTAMLLVSWLVPLALAPDRGLLLPLRGPDTLLYTVLIQRASVGQVHGDAFVWEHREDPASLFSFFHAWPLVLGKLYAVGGHLLLLGVSTALSGLWFWSLFRFAIRLGLPRPWAFFLAGLQTFFVVNLTYQVCGFKTSWSAYNLSVSEHARLYPSVVSMSIYGAAVLAVVCALQSPGLRRALLAAALVTATAYGRPFDWMVLLGALGFVGALLLTQRAQRPAFTAWSVLLLAGMFSLPFILGFMHWQEAHHVAYLDQISRGNLQVKMPFHYVKYAILCGLVLGAVAFAWRRCQPRDEGERRAVLWLIALVACSFLAHFKTALEGGVTLVGFVYLMVFSIVPWSFLLVGTFAWYALRGRRPLLFASRAWAAVFLLLLLLQQGVIGMSRVPTAAEARSQRGEANLLDALPSGRPVVLALGNGLQAASCADAWLFLPQPLAVTYTCAAPTAELLQRFLLAKLLLTGTLRDLAPLFSPDGLPSAYDWAASRDPRTRAWFARLRDSVGSNTFLFHPRKNTGEIRLRKLAFPSALLDRDEFVAFFDTDFRRVFGEVEKLEISGAPVLPALLRDFRLDAIVIPGEHLDEVNPSRLASDPLLVEVPPEGKTDGRLWRVLTLAH
jgi:hypothetical protein